MRSGEEGDTMCKDLINPNLPHWRRRYSYPVLHKLHPVPNPLIFTPIYPFKLSNILIWYSKPIIIQQIKIGNMNQLIYPVYEQQLTAPDTLEVVEESFKNGILPRMLRENHAYHLDFMIADSKHPMTIEFEGDFNVIALYGAEYYDNR